MNVVFVGHVDHGKSTVVGRLLADTNSLPIGKLEKIKQDCKNNDKVFEYAFLLDALKDEQSQGITIDTARCFFNSDKRDYIIIDAPGHIEFLKNMISGAARAEAAVLVIDAKEGVQENSKRHGYMLSMLGISQVVVCINKMDLVDYKEEVFNKIQEEYKDFLENIGIKAKSFIPISALEGENMIQLSEKMNWFKGLNVLSALDSFEKESSPKDKPFRMPIQGIYKFTGLGDSRRIIAGRIESGSIKIGDEVVFLPSGKQSKIKSIEGFNTEQKDRMEAGFSTGFTLEEQIYINRGELMCKVGEDLPYTSSLLKANLFWMGKEPMNKENEYKIKIGTESIPVKLKKIVNVMDASNLEKSERNSIKRHEVAECIFECIKPVSFDLFSDLQVTGRFVIVDSYDISGGGIITEFIEDSQSDARARAYLREKKWDSGLISITERSARYSQKPTLVLITGKSGVDKKTVAKTLEKKLFEDGRKIYFLGIGNLLRGLDSDIDKKKREEHIRRLGEVSHILMDAGIIVLATASDLNEEELKLLQTINTPDSMLIVNIGENGIDSEIIDLSIEPDTEKNVLEILNLMKFKNIFYSL